MQIGRNEYNCYTICRFCLFVLNILFPETIVDYP